MPPKKKAEIQRVKTAKELASLVNGVFGKDTVKMGSDDYFRVEYLPTGIAPVDELLQGGIPFGRFVEIFGDYSTLKSYIGLCAIRQCQQMGKLAALIDTEHAFDPDWAKEIGVDVEELILRHPPNGEAAIDLAEVLIRGGADFIVFDSVAAALPKAEQEMQLDSDKNVQPARLASLMSLAMRKLTAANSKTGVLWINQTRVNVGVMFGSNESVPGGKALPFYSSYRIAVRKAGGVTEKITVHVPNSEGKPEKKEIKQTVAQKIRMTLEKSKLNTPHREVMFEFDFRQGRVDDYKYLLYRALDEGIVEVERGRWWVTKKPDRKYHGEDEFKKAVSEEKLRSLLNVPSLTSPGNSHPVKSKAVAAKSASSKRGVRVNTRGQVRAGSSSTDQTKKQSTKSKTRRVVIRSRKS